MVVRKSVNKKPKNYAKLSQKQKFMAAAKAADADESGDAFTRALAKVVSAKRPK